MLGMNFWNINELAGRLKSSSVGDMEVLKYLISSSIFICLASSPLLPGEEPIFLYGVLELIFSLVITAAGICYYYKLNKNYDGLNFLERYTCLGFPVLIRTATAGFIGIIIVLIAQALFFGLQGKSRYFPEVIFALSILIQLLAFFYMRKGFLAIISPNKPDEKAEKFALKIVLGLLFLMMFSSLIIFSSPSYRNKRYEKREWKLDYPYFVAPTVETTE